MDADAVVPYVRTMDRQLDAALMRERLLARLSTGFGLVALLLAVVGLFGVMSYAVARRERETGIRIALGATSGAILRRVLGGALSDRCLASQLGSARRSRRVAPCPRSSSSSRRTIR